MMYPYIENKAVSQKMGLETGTEKDWLAVLGVGRLRLLFESDLHSGDFSRVAAFLWGNLFSAYSDLVNTDVFEELPSNDFSNVHCGAYGLSSGFQSNLFRIATVEARNDSHDIVHRWLSPNENSIRVSFCAHAFLAS
jgi:hypothetical protein